MRHAQWWKPLVLVAGLLGCGSGPQLAASRTAAPEAVLRAARQAGAGSVPQAAYHAELARKHIALARQLLADGRPDLAELTLMRAQADADLALVLAREAAVKEAAEQATGEAQELRE
jgi:hypothetical protein